MARSEELSYLISQIETLHTDMKHSSMQKMTNIICIAQILNSRGPRPAHRLLVRSQDTGHSPYCKVRNLLR